MFKESRGTDVGVKLCELSANAHTTCLIKTWERVSVEHFFGQELILH